MLKRLWSRFAGRLLRSREPELSEDDLDHMRSWSISAQLAAVPPNYEHQVPREVAALIRAAKTLHPQMARGAIDRQERGEPCPDLG
ncbi:MAG: hypothetical protein GAK28_04349 [Luteibacter sp.]|uniref:hypothetical protein n=1 Tax=Luteibacter sp. TaxID=1886636 RepID=UPI00138434B8|nr:hypothetical protein [Luteibacter sp.]KAF1003886.1 MAG: hypothetical protein GAK28_04349 [Luteibacter sp.]